MSTQFGEQAQLATMDPIEEKDAVILDKTSVVQPLKETTITHMTGPIQQNEKIDESNLID